MMYEFEYDFDSKILVEWLVRCFLYFFFLIVFEVKLYDVYFIDFNWFLIIILDILLVNMFVLECVIFLSIGILCVCSLM